MAEIRITKRGKVYQYQFEIASVDGKRKYANKSGFKTKNEREYGNTIYVNKESSSVIGSINAPVIFVYKDGTTLHTYVPLAKEREEFIHYLSLVRSKYRID